MFVLPSNHFRKCFSVNAGVWLRMENKIFGNYFQLTVCFEGFDPEMVWSENFHFKPFPDSRAKREKEPSTSTLSIYEPITPSTLPTLPITPSTSPIFDPEPSTYRSMNPRTDLWPRAFDFAGDPEPSRHEPTNQSLSLSLSLSLCDFDRPTNRSTFLCDFDFLLSLFDLWFFLLLLWWCGWWCFGGFLVVWWWVLCGWWWKIAFSECYQTHENIFFLNFHNATKYLKIFSFPENSISRKYLFSRKYFTWNKHSISPSWVWVFYF